MVKLDEALMVTADAALVLGVSPGRVRQLANDGTLPVYAKTVKGIRIFLEVDVMKLLGERSKGVG